MKKKFNLFNISNIILILAVIIGDIFYILESQLLVKTLASAAFVLIGLFSLFDAFKRKKENINFAMVMVVGLFFAMLGDILLELNFILGAAFFAIGHIFYFVAYCVLVKFKWIDLIAGGALSLFAILFICLAPFFNFGSALMQVVVIFYAIIISLMLGKAITNLIRERNLLNVILLIGSFLFFFSDLMLLLCNFTVFDTVVTQVLGVLCLATYYPAEILLAISINFIKSKKAE